MKTLAKETLQIVKLNWKNVLLFELLYRIITFPFFVRLISRGLTLALKLAGYSYLTAGNIGLFLLRPWTLLTILVIGGIGTMLLTLEIAGLISAFEGAAYGQKPGPLQIFWGGMQKLTEEIKRKNVKLGLLLLVDCFLINLFLLFRTTTHVKPLNFVMNELARNPAFRLLGIVILVICALVAIPGMFGSFGCMIEQKSFRDSMERSRVLLKNHRVKAVGLLLTYHVGAVFLIISAYFLSVLAAAIFVVLFTEKNLAMAVLLLVSDKLELILLFFGGIILMVVNFGALSVLYYQYGNRKYHESRWDFSDPSKGMGKKKRAKAVLLAVTAISLFYIFDLVQNGLTLSDEILTEIQITAHRGSSRTAPENTMSALHAAIEELADYGEIDVQLSSDGTVVLAHDASLQRVAGINRGVGTMTYEELQTLDVGSWFSTEYAGERIPTLEEVMTECKGRLNLNIELKNIGKNKELAQKVVELIQVHEMEAQCVVTSTNLNYLKEVREVNPQLRTGYIISAAYGNFYSSDAIDFISIRSSFVNEELVKNVHAQGKGVHAWTVNSKSEMERLRYLGVDNLITDYPVLAREILYREEATETLMEYLRLVLK